MNDTFYTELKNKRIAKKISLKEVSKITTRNAEKFFGI